MHAKIKTDQTVGAILIGDQILTDQNAASQDTRLPLSSSKPAEIDLPEKRH
jgi:hypothetical protein